MEAARRDEISQTQVMIRLVNIECLGRGGDGCCCFGHRRLIPITILHINCFANFCPSTVQNGHGKVLVWHIIDGKWCGAEAENLYRDAVAPALKKQLPRKKEYLILEDNDPTGNQSARGRGVKKDLALKLFRIPKRSPDLNVLDYFVWSEVERRLRKQEAKWPASRRETRVAFIRRLRRTALGLRTADINRAIGDMPRRCALLHKAKGELFEEGGRASKAARVE